MSQNPEYGKFLGARVVVTTSLSETMEGEIFCYDIEKSNSVILRHYNEKGNVSYKWLKTNIVRSVKSASPTQLNASEEKLAPINFDDVAKNASRVELQAKADMKNYGVGVTDRAQLIFDALNRTMQCSWEGEDILVFGVRIRPPYDPSSCSGGDDGTALERVKKVLDGELQRIEKKTKQKGEDKKDDGDEA